MASKGFLLRSSDFDPRTLGSLSDLIVRSLHQDIPGDDMEQFSQKQMIISGKRNNMLILQNEEEESMSLILGRAI